MGGYAVEQTHKSHTIKHNVAWGEKFSNLMVSGCVWTQLWGSSLVWFEGHFRASEWILLHSRATRVVLDHTRPDWVGATNLNLFVKLSVDLHQETKMAVTPSCFSLRKAEVVSAPSNPLSAPERTWFLNFLLLEVSLAILLQSGQKGLNQVKCVSDLGIYWIHSTTHFRTIFIQMNSSKFKLLSKIPIIQRASHVPSCSWENGYMQAKERQD